MEWNEKKYQKKKEKKNKERIKQKRTKFKATQKNKNPLILTNNTININNDEDNMCGG